MTTKPKPRTFCPCCGKIMDNGGAIAKDAQVAHSICKTCDQLMLLKRTYPECTRGWIGKISRELWIMEEWGLTHFGSGDAAAFNLVKQAKGRNWIQLNSYYSCLRAERTGA